MAESLTALSARITSLSLENFRNFERLDLAFPDAGFVLVGDNGQGKTNLLEGAYYLSLLRSVRGARDADVVRFGADGFFVAGRICVPGAHEIAIGFERAGRRKRIRKDGVVQERLSDAIGAIPTVMFSPADVALIAGGPGERRRFLDIMLALSSRGYLQALQRYRAALERRNAALRDTARHGRGASSFAAIEVWDAPLAEFGARLVRTRRAWVAESAAAFAARCEAIGEQAATTLQYQCTIDPNAESLEEALTAALAARRTTDLRLGITHVGPHRDDLTIALGGRDLRTFGSAGQQRTAAIALRTVEADTLRRARSAAPVFLLDDPFAELDAGRAARVLRLLREVGLGQTVLAVPRDADIPRELSDLPRARIADARVSFDGERRT